MKACKRKKIWEPIDDWDRCWEHEIWKRKHHFDSRWDDDLWREEHWDPELDTEDFGEET